MTNAARLAYRVFQDYRMSCVYARRAFDRRILPHVDTFRACWRCGHLHGAWRLRCPACGLGSGYQHS